MPKLIITIGPAGAGKSTYVEQIIRPKYQNRPFFVVNTDEIRKELWHDENDQVHNKETWIEAQKRLKEYLKGNNVVVLDATNVSRKDRNRILNVLASIPDLEKECDVLLCSLEQCMKNQESRQRKVPEEAVLKMLTRFQLPSKSEGWDDITFYNPFYDKEFANLLIENLHKCDQTSKWHTENAGNHTMLVERYIQQKWDNPILNEAAKFHDVGKPYTRMVSEDGETHFFGHANIGAYLYLCANVNKTHIDDKTAYIEQLIEHHMDLCNDIDLEKYGNKLDKFETGDLMTDLVRLHEADEHGAILRVQLKDMSVLDFMNSFEDWKERIQKDPFNIKIKENNDYILLKYNQLDSDMTYRLVQESRGSIFKKNDNRLYEYACRPFDKFFNYGEEQAAVIDWHSARVTEKVDGSLMKMFYDNDTWHLTTNASIDAFAAEVSDMNVSFGDIFERALGMNIQTFGKELDKNCTYMFELTSPETRVVIEYPDNVYYLSRRDTKSGQEYFDRPVLPGVKYPKIFELNDLHDTVEAVKTFSKNEEGVVVNDANGRRIKVKSPEYLIAAHIVNNGVLSNKKLVDYIKEEKTDDLLAYCPQYKERVEKMQNEIEEYGNKLDKEWDRVKEDADKSRAEFAHSIGKTSVSDYLFKKYDNPNLTVNEYISKMTTQNILRALGHKEMAREDEER